jgi:hypothetical protein
LASHSRTPLLLPWQERRLAGTQLHVKGGERCRCFSRPGR